ncbi:general stress protein, partial [Bacillus sp. BF9-10]
MQLGGGSTARKSPIGSTNNQWRMNPPLIKV